MSRQAMIAITVTVLGAAGVSLWSYRVNREGVTAGVWFDAIGPDASPEFAQHAGTALTGDELATLESVARTEVETAFAMTCVRITDSLDSRYRVRVKAGTIGLVAGQEHFYQPLHWTIAGPRLKARYGPGPGECPQRRA